MVWYQSQRPCLLRRMHDGRSQRSLRWVKWYDRLDMWDLVLKEDLPVARNYASDLLLVTNNPETESLEPVIYSLSWPQG